MTEKPESTHSYLGVRERNRLVTVSFCSALFGFVLAIYLGAFSVVELKEVPVWISAIAAAASVAISAFAVYLVSGTLNATILTLEATKEMAAAQSEAYDIEFRPQVLPAEVKISSVRPIDGGEFEVVLKISFRNFGKMAALRVSGQVIAGDIRGDETVDMDEYTGFWAIAMFQKSTLRPEGTFEERIVIRGNFEGGQRKLISPRLQYDDQRGHRHFDIEKAYYFVGLEGEAFFIKEASSFDITPHAGFHQEDIDEDQ